MSGQFFTPSNSERRIPKKHHCTLPDVNLVPTGRGWRCPCNRAWVVVTESQHGETWKAWKRSEEYDGRLV